MEAFFNQTHSIVLNDLQVKFLSKLEDSISHGKLKLITRSDCYQCKGTSFDILSEYDRHGLSVKSLLCRDCGLISSSPIFDQKSLEVFYDEFYVPINYGVEAPEHLYNKDQCRNIFLFLDEILEEQISILDVGCGTGDLIKYFNDDINHQFDSMTIFGCDYNSKLVSKINKALGKERVFHGGIDDVHIEEKFDLIILSHVFEHIIDPKKYLKTLKNRLKREGYVYLEVPSLFGHFQNYHNYGLELQRFFTIAHIFNFSNLTLRNMIESEGFRVIKSDSHVRMLIQYTGEYKKDVISDYWPSRFYIDKTLPKLRLKNEEDGFQALQERIFPFYQTFQIEKISSLRKDRFRLEKTQEKVKELEGKLLKHRKEIRIANYLRRLFKTKS